MADPTNVDVEICHIKHLKTADGRQRHRILSLNSVLEDSSGEYNCMLNDGDVVTVRMDPNARPSATEVPVSRVATNATDEKPLPSPKPEFGERFSTRAYRVHDLVFLSAQPGEVFDFLPLIELIKTTVAPTS